MTSRWQIVWWRQIVLDTTGWCEPAQMSLVGCRFQFMTPHRCWLMWTCTDVIGWLQISVDDTMTNANCLVSTGWCQLVDVSLYRCHWLSADFSWHLSDDVTMTNYLVSAGWCQLVDVNLPHRCHWLFDDPRRLRHWRDAVWWPGFSWCHLTSLFHCCSLSEMSKMLCLLQWSILSSAPYPRIQTRAKGF